MKETKPTANVPLTEATSDLIDAIKSDNRKSRNLGFVAIVMLIVVMSIGVIGIYKQNKSIATQNQAIILQNQLAKESKDHIDCIIKDLATPLPDGSQHKIIELLGTECHIKFTP